MWTPISESLKLKTKFDMPESSNLIYSDMIVNTEEQPGASRWINKNIKI